MNPDGELEHIQLDEELDYQANTFFNMINRGGLARPPDFTFMLTIHCWRVYEEIKSSKEIMGSFLKIQCQRTLFSKIMERAVSHVSLDIMFACPSMCTKGHDLRDLLVRKFFNCLAKNLVKDLSAEANMNSKGQSSKQRKIAKLSSSSKSSG